MDESQNVCVYHLLLIAEASSWEQVDEACPSRMLAKLQDEPQGQQITGQGGSRSLQAFGTSGSPPGSNRASENLGAAHCGHTASRGPAPATCLKALQMCQNAGGCPLAC